MNTKPKVTKAVIAAAGFGTRFLPQTKAMPKEMLPIVDKPVIQYVIEELVESGITDIIIVTNYHKRVIEDHFDAANAELVNLLKAAGKYQQLERLEQISALANIAFVRQKKAIGNIGPVFFAKDWLDDQPFIYTWADDFIKATPPRFAQMIAAYQRHGSSVLSCIEADQPADFGKYAYVGGQAIDKDHLEVSVIVEKPGAAKAPSSMASVSGFLLKPEIISFVERTVQATDLSQPQVDLQIQTAIQAMIEAQHPVIALKIQAAQFYDAGNKLGYLEAVVDFALQDADIADDFRQFLSSKDL